MTQYEIFYVIHSVLDRLQNKHKNYKWIKNNTSFGQITGVQEKLDKTCKFGCRYFLWYEKSNRENINFSRRVSVRIYFQNLWIKTTNWVINPINTERIDSSDVPSDQAWHIILLRDYTSEIHAILNSIALPIRSNILHRDPTTITHFHEQCLQNV